MPLIHYIKKYGSIKLNLVFSAPSNLKQIKICYYEIKIINTVMRIHFRYGSHNPVF